ncbi:MAG: Rrf2 family transcriptional regulator [Candidatus Omnitrophica bacterium]|nr:Rrf2 family transcriptional regulator [Candidatus Omnitrophota bacterium]
MKLPAKVIYACRAITELALRYETKEPVQLQVIAEAQKIPKKFLVQLFIRLRNAGIVSSMRGVSGGYNLAKNPVQLCVADVVKAMDDTLIVAENHDTKREKPNVDRLLFGVWSDINQGIIQRLEKITFDSIVTQLKNEELTYFI